MDRANGSVSKVLATKDDLEAMPQKIRWKERNTPNFNL